MDDVLTCDHLHGPLVGGRYRLGQVLRSGPGRCEHSARDELLRRTVTTLIAAPSTGHPLPREVPLPVSARIEHGPGLADVFDGGGDGGVLYLVVPRPDGTCLADTVATGPLPVTEVRAVGAEIARALWPIHRRGCAHGALGADLVTQGRSGVTVAGLGVDEWLRRWAAHRCDPPWPAPEQRAADPAVSPATDVYALGRLLGHAAGRLPRSEPLRAVLDVMTLRDPALRPTTLEVVDLLTGDAVPALPCRRRPSSAGRSPAGTVAALAVAGALALGGLVVHTAGSSTGLLGGATLGAIPALSPAFVPGPVVVADQAVGHRPSGPSIAAASHTSGAATPAAAAPVQPSTRSAPRSSEAAAVPVTARSATPTTSRPDRTAPSTRSGATPAVAPSHDGPATRVPASGHSARNDQRTAAPTTAAPSTAARTTAAPTSAAPRTAPTSARATSGSGSSDQRTGSPRTQAGSPRTHTGSTQADSPRKQTGTPRTSHTPGSSVRPSPTASPPDG